MYETLRLHAEVVDSCFARTRSCTEGTTSDLFAEAAFEVNGSSWLSCVTVLLSGMPDSRDYPGPVAGRSNVD